MDTLYPHYAVKEMNIIKKIKELFPDYDLQNIIEEYNFDNSQKFLFFVNYFHKKYKLKMRMRDISKERK